MSKMHLKDYRNLVINVYQNDSSLWFSDVLIQNQYVVPVAEKQATADAALDLTKRWIDEAETEYPWFDELQAALSKGNGAVLCN